MISFKQFLSEDKSKTKLISAEDAIAWMKKNAKQYLKNGKYLFRGFDNQGIQLGNSEDFIRKSIDGSPNFYTMWIDNNPMFKDWPKRSKSFICTSRPHKASMYGSIFIVIPNDKNKAGIVNDDDIWDKEIISPDITLHRLEDIIKEIFQYFHYDFETYSEFQDSLKKININNLQDLLTDENLDIPRLFVQRIQTLTEEMENKKINSLFDFWSTYVSPKLFDQTSTSNFPDLHGEVWIQGECLFLPLDSTQYLDDDKNKILKWAKSYPEFFKILPAK